jgi:hypothetical protein
MVLRLTLLAALAAVAATTGLTPDHADHRLDPDEIALLLAAAIGTDTFRVRR